MFKSIQNVLTGQEVAELRAIAASAKFIDGRISAPGAPLKNNLVVGDRALFDRSAQIVAAALYRSEDFRVFAFPRRCPRPFSPATARACITAPTPMPPSCRNRRGRCA